MQKSLLTSLYGVSRLFVWDFIAVQIFKLAEDVSGVWLEYWQGTDWPEQHQNTICTSSM